MTTVKKCKIQVHGENLLRIFPNATEQDPVKLCKKLRRLELAGNVFALRLCNGPPYSSQDAEDREAADILARVNAVLGNDGLWRRKHDGQFDRTENPVPVFVNRDPRGYALKIRDEWVRDNNVLIERDWGGYGIIAPEF